MCNMSHTRPASLFYMANKNILTFPKILSTLALSLKKIFESLKSALNMLTKFTFATFQFISHLLD
jgi:hypothetical protein